MVAKAWEEYKAECEAVAKPGITILGWVGEWKGHVTKLRCVCAKHGEWQSTTIHNFKSGRSCPGCKRSLLSQNNSKTWEEYLPSIKSTAEVKGYTIEGYEGWNGNQTRLRLVCPVHGRFNSTTIGNFLQGSGCPKCGKKTAGEKNSKPDEEHVAEFFATGMFKDGCKFWRSPKLTARGWAQYWYHTCPICSEDEFVKAGLCTGVFESHTSQLKRGGLPCRCSGIYRFTKAQWEWRLVKECENRGYVFVGWKGKRWGRKFKFSYECTLHGEQSITPHNLFAGHGCPLCAGYNQQQCYINLVSDQNIPLACKIGIAKDSEARLKSQNQRNLFQMQQLAVYEFPTVEDCKAAERACLSELTCGVLSARELQDGYTETVALTDYDKVVSIYERFGGVRVDTLTDEDV